MGSQKTLQRLIEVRRLFDIEEMPASLEYFQRGTWDQLRDFGHLRNGRKAVVCSCHHQGRNSNTAEVEERLQCNPHLHCLPVTSEMKVKKASPQYLECVGIHIRSDQLGQQGVGQLLISTQS